eukprot:2668675-Prymnesium_polylepis.2
MNTSQIPRVRGRLVVYVVGSSVAKSVDKKALLHRAAVSGSWRPPAQQELGVATDAMDHSNLIDFDATTPARCQRRTTLARAVPAR